MSRRYEVRTFTTPAPARSGIIVQNQLAQFYAEGWRVVAATTVTVGGGTVCYVLEREVFEPEVSSAAEEEIAGKAQRHPAKAHQQARRQPVVVG